MVMDTSDPSYNRKFVAQTLFNITWTMYHLSTRVEQFEYFTWCYNLFARVFSEFDSSSADEAYVYHARCADFDWLGLI